MSSIYQEIINQGYHYNKSYEEIMQALSANNELNTQSLSMMKTLYPEETKKATAGKTIVTNPDGTTTMTDTPKMTSEQQKQKDSLQQALASLEKYRSIVDKNISEKKPFDLTGKDKAEMESIGNLMMFNIATAQGTGALQAPDRDVIESAIAIPTGIKGAGKSITSGGKEGVMAGIDNAQALLNSNLNLLTKGEQGQAYDEQGTAKETPQDVKETIDATIEYARNNPDDPQAQQFLKDWDNHNIDLETGEIINKSEEQMTPFEKEQAYRESIKPPEEEKMGFMDATEDRLTKMGIVAESPMKQVEKVGSAFGENYDTFQEINADDKITGQEAYHMIGATAKTMNQVMGAGMSLATPDFVEKGVGALVKLGMETDTAKAVVNEWQDFEKQNPQLAQTLKDTGQIGMFVSAVVGLEKGVSKKGKKYKEPTLVAKKPKVKPTKEQVVTSDKAVTRMTKDLKDISRGTKKMKNQSEAARQSGVPNVEQEVAKTGVVRGAVNSDGKVTTKGAGGPLETYRKEYIEPIDDAVSTGLKKEGKVVPVDSIKKYVEKTIDEDTLLRGKAGEQALNRVTGEIDSLAKKFGDDAGNIHLDEVHNLKRSMYKGINYDNPKVAMGDKTAVRGLKEFIENESDDVAVKQVNDNLTKMYATADYIEALDGAIVKGGRLGKYTTQIIGSGVGGALGSAIGGPFGGAIGAAGGAAIGDLAKGLQMANKLK